MHDFPSQGVAHPSQVAGFGMPQGDDVLRMKRYDKIFAVAANRYLSPKRKGVPSEGFDDIKR